MGGGGGGEFNIWGREGFNFRGERIISYRPYTLYLWTHGDLRLWEQQHGRSMPSQMGFGGVLRSVLCGSGLRV